MYCLNYNSKCPQFNMTVLGCRGLKRLRISGLHITCYRSYILAFCISLQCHQARATETRVETLGVSVHCKNPVYVILIDNPPFMSSLRLLMCGLLGLFTMHELYFIEFTLTHNLPSC